MVSRDGGYDFNPFQVHIKLLIASADQEVWAIEFLHKLLELDRRLIFTLVLYVPDVTQGSAAISQVAKGLVQDRLLRTDQPLNLSWYIESEWSAEAGNMAISSRCVFANSLPFLTVA